MEKCIDSLLLGGERVEIIIIADGSKDKTGEIADAYAKEYPNIVKVIHQENGGHGEGINQGVKYATGKYFKVFYFLFEWSKFFGEELFVHDFK